MSHRSHTDYDSSATRKRASRAGEPRWTPGAFEDEAVVAAPSRQSAEEKLSSDVLAIALWLSLWLAVGSLVLAVADGLGPHPARRLVIGVSLVSLSAAALWRRKTVGAWLRAHPGTVLILAAAELGVAAIDGLRGGPYVAFSMTSIAVAVVVARPRTVFLCVALLDAGYALAIAVDQTPAALVGDGVASVMGVLLGYPFTALVGLGVVRLFTRFLANVDPTLDAMRHGGRSLTSALDEAIERGGHAHRELPPAGAASTSAAASVRLTAAERRVVEELAGGSAPKELAHRWGVSVATVRTHIKHAKRKTGARTLAELAAMTVRADWPDMRSRVG